MTRWMLKEPMTHDGSEQYMDYYNVRAFLGNAYSAQLPYGDGSDDEYIGVCAVITYISFGLKDTLRENHSVALAS